MYNALIYKTYRLKNMKPNPFNYRYRILWIVILCYLLPLTALLSLHPLFDPWTTLSSGMLLTVLGALFYFWILLKWESNWKSFNLAPAADIEIPPQSNSEMIEKALADEQLGMIAKQLEEAHEVQTALKNENENLSAHLQQAHFDKEQTSQQMEQTLKDWEEYRKDTYKQMEQQQAHIQQLQSVIADHKSVLEKKQQLTGLLETKVSDLTYEIKTLLQLAEAHSGSIYGDVQPSAHSTFTQEQEDTPAPTPERQIRTSDEASLQLKRCLDIAQKITGSNRFNSQFNPFLDSPADSFTLDLRRLCDSLRSENSCTILLYSPKENQLLFANNQIRSLTGWSPDKFVQNFNDIVQDEASWRQGITSLTMRSEAQIQFSLKTRSGHDIIVKAHLGMIPTGIFRQHAIAVLYS